jgi:hypothetical protein
MPIEYEAGHIAAAGLIESVKQLRETLMIQEWDLHSRHHAQQKCAGNACYLPWFNIHCYSCLLSKSQIRCCIQWQLSTVEWPGMITVCRGVAAFERFVAEKDMVAEVCTGSDLICAGKDCAVLPHIGLM